MPEITRCFDATAEGWRRIAAVTGPAEEVREAVSLEASEIAPEELPPGFHEWRRYAAYVVGRAVVEVFSPDGS